MPGKGKKRTTTRVVEEERDEQLGEDITDLAEVAEEEVSPDVERILEELGPEVAHVQLLRKDPRTQRYALVRTYYPNEFTIEGVRAEYGGGEFQVQIKDEKWQYKRGRNFTIEGPPRYPSDEFAKPGAVAGEGGPMVMELLREVLATVRQPQQVGPVEGRDAMDTAIKMVEMMQSSIATTLTPLVAALTSRAEPNEDPWAAFDRGIELGEKLGKVAGGGGGMEDTAMQLAGEVLGFLRDSRTGKRIEAPKPPQLAEGAPVWARQIAPLIPQLIALAQQNRRPDLYAEVVIDNMDGATASFLAEQLATRGEAFVDEFYLHFPQATPFKEWIDLLFGELYRILLGVEEPEDGGGSVEESEPTVPSGESTGHEGQPVAPTP